MHRGEGNNRLASHIKGFDLIETFSNLSPSGEGKEGSVGDMNQNIFTDKVFSRFTSHFLLKQTAFTLAEVLITLGIIGVVAAMTMPSLIAHHRKVATASKLKKFYSTMEQAIRFGEAEYGDSNEWVKPATQKDENGNVDNDAQGRVSKENLYNLQYFAKCTRNVSCG